jgi:ABC-type antimicrobial peptide transport system permease subunit
MPRTMNVIVRVKSGDPASLAPALRAEVRAIDPGAALSDLAGMPQVLSRTAGASRLMAWVLSAFAAVAVTLAAVGVYGVTACNVSTRTTEFGVRMALGATSRDVIRQVIVSSVLPLAAGTALGIAGALASGRLLAGMLFGVAPSDPLALVIATSVITVAAVSATLAPAVRAARLDPLAALRQP